MDKTKALYEVIESSRAFMNQMNELVDQIHQDYGINSCSRGVMLILKSEGLRTIPQLAKNTQRSRQYLQKMITQMQKIGLINLIPNPDHKTSNLIELSEHGKQILVEMLDAESTLINRVDIPIEIDQLKNTSNSLNQLTQTFQNT